VFPLYFFTMNQEKRLFIIDDEPTMLNLLQEYLEQFHLKVFTYETIPNDLEHELKEKAPQAVLLDIFMPRVSGIDILKKIKTIDSQIPVIMMTGYADEEKRIESLRNGAYALLLKPFHNLEEVYHNVNNAMSHYLEILRTKELSSEVEERYKREKMNLLELDFLKNLQNMIGEAEDPVVVLKSAYTLFKNFLNFEYFAVLLLRDDEINIQVYPHLEKDRKVLEYIAQHF
jgi:DNA-binding NtrC family response regulator